MTLSTYWQSPKTRMSRPRPHRGLVKLEDGVGPGVSVEIVVFSTGVGLDPGVIGVSFQVESFFFTPLL